MHEAAMEETRLKHSHLTTYKTSVLIIGVEIADRLAFSAIHASLVTYFTQIMNQKTATAARNVNIWAGVSFTLPFLGAFVADSYLGRYKTIILSSFAYLMGLSLMILSYGIPSLRDSYIESVMFFIGIYLVAVGQGGYKPCLQAFGADQFGDEDLKREKSSFFNWWYFGVCIGSFMGTSVIVYIQDKYGWISGYGIPALVMALALAVFLSWTSKYLHKPPGGSPLTRIAHVFVATYHKWNSTASHTKYKGDFSQEQEQSLLMKKRRRGERFRFLDKAAVADELDSECENGRNWKLCTLEQVTEVKNVLNVLTIWVPSLIFGLVFAQYSTFFTKQGSTMNKKLGNLEIPAASLQCLVVLPVILLVPVYDKVFVPMAKKLTGNDRGITLLQRIGTGMLISGLAMTVSALIEIKRINTAIQYGLVDYPDAIIPMSIFWLVPQYILIGIADLFSMVGMQEFFYEEMPEKLKSMGIAVYLSIIGIGNMISGVLISIIKAITCKQKSSCWISNNLNEGHLYYFYLFLAALSALNFCLFLILASNYEYKNDRDDAMDGEEPVP